MPKLDHQIREWVDKGFITSTQASQITNYEAAKPRNSWLQYGLMTLGVSVVGMGLISLVAANWQQIPDAVKLATAFVLLSTIAVYALSARKTKKAAHYDVAIFAFQIASLATIGLISQIFHSTGQLYEAILFLCLITLPATMTTHYAFVPFIWTGSFLCSFLYWLADSKVIGLSHNGIIIILALSPLVTGLLAVLARIVRASPALVRSIQWWLLISALVGLVTAESYFDKSPFIWGSIENTLKGNTATAVFYGMSILIAALLATAKPYSALQKALLVSTLAVYILSFHMPLDWPARRFLAGAITLTELILLGAFFITQNARGLFNFILILIGVRFFVFFLEAVGGLAATGFGLILSGLVLIGLALIWSRKRNQIAQWVERLLQ